MANRLELQHQAFWMKAYLASARRGNSPDTCAALADVAVQKFIERTETPM